MARIDSPPLEKHQTYLGQALLRKAGVKLPWTKEMFEEYVRCADDPIYFITTYCKIISLDHGEVPFAMWPYQKELILQMHLSRFLLVMLPRQMGKTQIAAAHLLHQVIFNKNYTVAILANKDTAAREVLDRIQFMYSGLPSWLQHGVTTWNKGDIKLDNGSKIFTAATSVSAIRGKSCNCVTGDAMITIVDDSGAVYHTPIKDAPTYADLSSSDNYVHQDQKGDSMYYTVYEIKNLVNGKIYVGYHQTNNLDDGYMGSGKLIQRAVAKYGPASFEKRYIGIFDNRNEAESLEAKIVDYDFTQRDDTYNLCLGGNIRAMAGVNNPFYGKKHTKISMAIAAEKRRGMVTGTGICVMYGGIVYSSIYKLVQAEPSLASYAKINKELRDGRLCFVDTDRQAAYLQDLYKKTLAKIENSAKLSEAARERFKGKARSLLHRTKISDSLSGRARPYNQILNRDPDKIKKTAEKHTGMKRSEESRARMSESRKAAISKVGMELVGKGSVYAHDPSTKKVKRFDSITDVPAGWVAGNPSISSKGTVMYNNGEITKKFRPGEQPADWVRGMLKCKS